MPKSQPAKTVKKPTAARKRPAITPIATGQTWQLKAGQLQVTGIGKLLASYKVFRAPGQKGVQTQMSGIANLQKYLKTNKAVLIIAAVAA